MSALHVLLPALSRVPAEPAFARWLRQGDRLPAAPGGAQRLRELFRFAGDALPVAALRHLEHAADAASGAWLCADPAWVQSEANGARLLACPLADVGSEEAEALAASVRVVFGDAGVPLSVDAPNAWCLHLARAAPPVRFVDPQQALGADLLACLPEGTDARLWRRLFNDAQVALHAHPVNAARRAAGKRPVNALWFWGAGALPAGVTSPLRVVASSSDVVRGLAKLAGALRVSPVPDAIEAAPAGDALLDLDPAGHAEDIPAWRAPFQRWLRQGRFDTIETHFADGARIRIRHAHRLRFWRRA